MMELCKEVEGNIGDIGAIVLKDLKTSGITILSSKPARTELIVQVHE